MKKEMTQVAVETTEEGYIHLIQDDPMVEEPSIVQITPEQAQLLISWIERAHDEISSREASE